MFFDDDQIRNELNKCMLEHFENESKLLTNLYKLERSNRKHWQYAAIISWVLLSAVLVILYDCLF